MNLTTVVLLARHLTPENHREVLDSASYKSKRQIEEIVARLCPRPPVPALVRRLPNRSQVFAASASSQETGRETPLTGESSLMADHAGATAHVVVTSFGTDAVKRAVVEPLAPERYKIQFTANSETYEKLRRVQELLRHQIPDGDVGQVMDKALTMLLENLTRKKVAATHRPREGGGTGNGSRHIPAAVKRAVWARDGGRCAFISKGGRRCHERGFLEFHHVVPHARGGEPTVDNVQLRCRAHNGYESEQYYGWVGRSFVREERRRYSFRTEYRRTAASGTRKRWVDVCSRPRRLSKCAIVDLSTAECG